MKTFDVTVQRIVVQTAVLRVEAPDKRTAALHADVAAATWTDVGAGDIRVKAVDAVLPLIETKGPMPSVAAKAAEAEPAKGGKKAA